MCVEYRESLPTASVDTAKTTGSKRSLLLSEVWLANQSARGCCLAVRPRETIPKTYPGLRLASHSIIPLAITSVRESSLKVLETLHRSVWWTALWNRFCGTGPPSPTRAFLGRGPAGHHSTERNVVGCVVDVCGCSCDRKGSSSTTECRHPVRPHQITG